MLNKDLHHHLYRRLSSRVNCRVQFLLRILNWTGLFAFISWFAFIGSPHQKPLGFYILAGLLFIPIVTQALSVDYRNEGLEILVLDLVLIYFYSLFIRLSSFIRLVYTSHDHFALFGRAQRIAQLGFNPPGLLYEEAPYYLFSLVSVKLISGIKVDEIRFFTIAIFAILPIILSIYYLSMTNDPNSALMVSAIISVFPLFLRISTIIEAEFMIILIASAILLNYLRLRRSRSLFITSLLIGLSALIHHLYSLVILSLVLSANIIQITPTDWDDLDDNRILAVTGFAIIILSFVLWSNYASISIGFIAQIFRPSSIESVLGVFIPTGGAVATGAGLSAGSSEGGFLATFLKFYPLLVIAIFAIVGFAISVVSERSGRDDIPHGAAGIVLVTTLIAIATSNGSDYQVRFYYFVGIFLALLGATGIDVLISFSNNHNYGTYIQLSLVLLLCSYAITGTITPLGNNVDPRLGGAGFDAATQVEVDSINSNLSNGEKDLFHIKNLQKSCTNNSYIWSNGRRSICGPST